jgi:hypothetical protein
MSKIIKKILKLISFLLLFLPVILWGVLQSSAIQDYGVARVVGLISEELGISIEYTDVRLTSFNRIRFNDLLISDQRNDTLIYSSQTRAVFPVIFSILFKKNPERIIMKELDLDDAILKLYIDSLRNVNLQFIVDYINSNRDTTKVKKENRIKEINITNSKFSIIDDKKGVEREGIDFSEMVFTPFDLQVKDLITYDGILNMDIIQLSLQDKSGFVLHNLQSHLEICTSYMKYSNLIIKTPYSNIEADSINMSFDLFSDFSPPDLFNKVLFNLRFTNSKLDCMDLGFFTDFFWMNSQLLELSGQFSGLLSNLKGNDIKIGWGEQSYIMGDFDMNGLPDARETFLIFDLKDLITNVRDLTSLNLPRNTKISLPSNFEKLQNFRYRGNFTGFFNDFVAYGHLNTNLGEVYTDVMFAPDSANRIAFDGRLKAEEFSIGRLFNNEELVDDITIDAEINGILTRDGPLMANVYGKIDKFTLNKYPYQNIEVDGTFSNKRFRGNLNVSDPNLAMEFTGLIDLAANPRKYDFSANIIDADLTALQISDSDPDYHASFLIQANAVGQSVDELNGEIKLLNSLFSKTNKQIQVYGIELVMVNTKDYNEMQLRSDILDANISGQYKITGLKDDILFYLKQYISAAIPIEYSEYQSSTSRLNFDIAFKRTEPFFEFFFPDYLIGENSTSSGIFEPANNHFFRLDGFAPFLKVKNNSWHGLVLNINTEDSILITSLGSRVFNVNERIDLENFSLESQIQNNHLQFTTRWLNWDSTLYKGSLNGDVYFLEDQPKLAFKIDLEPSSITVSDTTWKIEPASLVYDSAGMFIDSMMISHDDQYLVAYGRLSDIPGDSLDFSFQNFNLANLNFFTRKKDFEFQGRLNGESKFTGIKENPLFFSSLRIDNMYVNRVEFGNCHINSVWDNMKQSLSIDAEARRGNLTMLDFTGDYFPTQSGKMDFRISLNKLKTDIFNPFLSGIFSDMRGLATGDMQLTGIKGKPNLSGNIRLQKNAFTIDYLKTRYNFSSDLEVVNNNFILNNIEVFDEEGNMAIVNGMIHTDYLRDLSLNINVTTNNLLCLNTRETDNSLFYGTAYAIGSIRIKGVPASLSFNIDAKTGANTRFFIPLSEETDVSEFNYITLIQKDTSVADFAREEIEYKVDLTGIQMDFNLDVTPDAEVQIIFDSKMGDIIKARGNGEMKMEINTLGTFDLVGDYTIEKGEYLFTMQDVINKRLKIEPGSNLRWTGDPLNAQVDITAVYRTRASLSDLFGTTDDPTVSQGKVTVDCEIFLKEDLMSPSIKYDIYLPYSEEDTRSRVESKITSEEELTKQFLSLMVLNRFYFPSEEGGGGSSAGNIAGVNASELLSNQLSNWLSQISNDVDIGVNYRPGTSGVTGDEVEVALSTQLLNDRLSINGSVDITNAEANNTNNIVGDVDIDYKITKSGKVRVRAFNRANDEIIRDRSPYTQGVGVFYMEEFNSFGELMGQYWAALTGKRKKKKSSEADADID